MTLSAIKENKVNTDNNGIKMMIGEETARYSVDLTGNGDYLTIAKFDNDIWAVEDDLQAHTHFTEDIETTLEAYIDDEEDKERTGVLKSLLKQATL